MEIIGHRGAAEAAPENTLAAVREGFREGADAVEIDIHRSRDGRIVVIHDGDTRRTTGHTGMVANMTWAEIERLDAGRWKGPAWEGQRIPSLEAVLEVLPPGKRLLIEVKCGPEVLEELARILKRAARKPEETVVMSFNLALVRQAKQRISRCPVYWIQGTTPRRNAETGAETGTVADLIETCRQGRLDGLNLAHDSRILPEHVERLYALGIRLGVWTVNQADAARRVAQLGVDSITSDRPGWLRAELGRKASFS